MCRARMAVPGDPTFAVFCSTLIEYKTRLPIFRQPAGFPDGVSRSVERASSLNPEPQVGLIDSRHSWSERPCFGIGLVSPFRSRNGLLDFSAAVSAFVGEVDLGHAPIGRNVPDVHRKTSYATGANNRS